MDIGSYHVVRKATRMKHFAFTAVLAVALTILSACGRSASRETEIESPVPVIAEPVRLGNIRTTISATGVVTILPGAELSVIAPQPARIAEITKNIGDAVKSGEVIVRFEFPSLRAQTAVNAAAVKAADLRLQQARLAQTRIRSLLLRGAASQREMDDADREATLAEGELVVATAAMNAAEAVGQNSSIRAPFNGTVTQRLHNPGDLVRPDPEDPILRLIDPKQVQVTATLPTADLTRFVVGATARAMAEGPPSRGETVLGGGSRVAELLRVVSRPQPEAGATAAAVTLAFDSPTELAPGTQVGVEIDAEQRSNVPLVPAIAVLKDDGNNPVVVVAAGSIAQRRPVVTGVMDGQQIEIRSGLKAGELIITQGHSSLRDGTPISVTSP
jgi:RND family efflux transporter MFP subunit